MKSLADPTKLKPIPEDGILQIVIETPAKSRNKFAFDPDQEIFTLKSILPAGMVFPYDFGFVPGTKGGDGDPVDVLLLMDEPAYPGISVNTKLIGVIEGEQIEGKRRIRNDRLVAVAVATHQYAKIKTISDLPKEWIEELEKFFVNYHEMQGKQYRLLGCKGPKTAFRLVKESRKK